MPTWIRPFSRKIKLLRSDAFLAKDRLVQSRDINGIAVDSISTDALTVAGKTSPPLQVHIELHRAGKYQIEMIANPDQLPSSGAYLIVAPMKVRGGSGAPARIFGIASMGG